jgi:hypothetical protein
MSEDKCPFCGAEVGAVRHGSHIASGKVLVDREDLERITKGIIYLTTERRKDE